MKKKIVIVGGGIIGCISAIYLVKAGHQVTILEQKNKLGGVLIDQKINKNIFYSGTQYFDADENWFKVLKTLVPEFKIFNFNYGSFTKLDSSKIISDNFSLPIFDFKLNQIKKKNINDVSSIDDRIKIYPKNIYTKLKKFLLKTNLNLKTISEKCLGNLGVSRIALKNDSGLYNLKLKDDFYNKFFAVCRNNLFQNKLKYSLPISGYDSIFLKLEKKLKKLGVKIELNCMCKVKWNYKKFEIYSNKSIVENDYIFWSGNPTPLIKEYNNIKLESYVFRTIQISANLQQTKLYEKYVQVYSNKSDIFRINLYTINKIPKISIECFYNKLSPQIILKEAKNIIKCFRLNYNFNKKIIHKTFINRFDLFSINDEKNIDNFIKSTKKTNLICSPWTLYGRTGKINNIVKNLKKLKLINN